MNYLVFKIMNIFGFRIKGLFSFIKVKAVCFWTFDYTNV